MNFKYCLILRGDGISCMGFQFVELIEAISQCNEGKWFVGDVTFNEYDVRFANYGESRAQLLGSNKDLINMLDPDKQLYSGVFLLFKNGNKIPREIEVYTEADMFENFGSEDIQIRAFDTSYFEVCTSDENLVNFLEAFPFNSLKLSRTRKAM